LRSVRHHLILEQLANIVDIRKASVRISTAQVEIKKISTSAEQDLFSRTS
jgi:hypothetical protein